MSRRVGFDELVAELAAQGCEVWDDLRPENRRRLVRLYFQETCEWGDALFGTMDWVLDAFEFNDQADFGLAVSQKMNAYVRPYVEKQLKYRALCNREQEEMRA